GYLQSQETRYQGVLIADAHDDSATASDDGVGRSDNSR
ncbi:MAG: hypothetical protein JWM06_1835, partial [Actinomycetia bacterium]|nr:hypothetical protein [Actinomycetes bacterium]